MSVAYSIDEGICNDYCDKKHCIIYHSSGLNPWEHEENGFVFAVWLKHLIELKYGETPKKYRSFCEKGCTIYPSNSEYLEKHDLTVRLHGSRKNYSYIHIFGHGKNKIDLYHRVYVDDYNEENEYVYLLVDDSELERFNFVKDLPNTEFYFKSLD